MLTYLSLGIIYCFLRQVLDYQHITEERQKILNEIYVLIGKHWKPKYLHTFQIICMILIWPVSFIGWTLRLVLGKYK